MITLRHTTVGRTPLDEGSAWCRDFYLTTLTTDIHTTGGIFFILVLFTQNRRRPCKPYPKSLHILCMPRFTTTPVRTSHPPARVTLNCPPILCPFRNPHCTALRRALWWPTWKSSRTHGTQRASAPFRAHNSSKRVAVDPHLKPRGHWDRLTTTLVTQNVSGRMTR